MGGSRVSASTVCGCAAIFNNFTTLRPGQADRLVEVQEIYTCSRLVGLV